MAKVLQHQDGHSLLNAIAFPTVRAYDPAYAYETAVIVMDGLQAAVRGQAKRRCTTSRCTTRTTSMPAMPEGCEEGIIRGMYKFRPWRRRKARTACQLFGSGAILRHALSSSDSRREVQDVSSDVWSVTSYTELRRDAQECERWNMLHPTQPPRESYVERALAGIDDPFVASSDYVRVASRANQRWVPGELFALGTDGMGRSESRGAAPPLRSRRRMHHARHALPTQENKASATANA